MHNLRSSRVPAAMVDRNGFLHAALPNMTSLLANELGKRASRRLPEAVVQSLWSTGRYQSNRHLVLTAQKLGQRLLVRASTEPMIALSEREKEIAWLYAAGNSYKEVARTLGVSPTTVRTHLSRIYQKLEVSDKGSLAIWLKEHS